MVASVVQRDAVFAEDRVAESHREDAAFGDVLQEPCREATMEFKHRAGSYRSPTGKQTKGTDHQADDRVGECPEVLEYSDDELHVVGFCLTRTVTDTLSRG